MVEMKLTTIILGGDGKGNNYMHVKVSMLLFVYVEMLIQALEKITHIDPCHAGCQEIFIGKSREDWE